MEQTRRNPASFLLAIFTLIFLITGSAIAQTNEVVNLSNIRIKNFGQMDERFFRGGQPKEDEYKQLAALGITTVIDLTDHPKSYEQPAVESLGMHYINIPMSDKKYPDTAQIDQFLKLVDNPATGKFYVHCAGGRHRTGVMGAVYRFNHYHWNFDQVYSEMKKYDFYTRWGHGNMKKFVKDYSVNFNSAENADTQHAVVRQQ